VDQLGEILVSFQEVRNTQTSVLGVLPYAQLTAKIELIIFRFFWFRCGFFFAVQSWYVYHYPSQSFEMDGVKNAP
jgi:hypothetical protein